MDKTLFSLISVKIKLSHSTDLVFAIYCTAFRLFHSLWFDEFLRVCFKVGIIILHHFVIVEEIYKCALMRFVLFSPGIFYSTKF